MNEESTNLTEITEREKEKRNQIEVKSDSTKIKNNANRNCEDREAESRKREARNRGRERERERKKDENEKRIREGFVINMGESFECRAQCNSTRFHIKISRYSNYIFIVLFILKLIEIKRMKNTKRISFCLLSFYLFLKLLSFTKSLFYNHSSKKEYLFTFNHRSTLKIKN